MILERINAMAKYPPQEVEPHNKNRLRLNGTLESAEQSSHYLPGFETHGWLALGLQRLLIILIMCVYVFLVIWLMAGWICYGK